MSPGPMAGRATSFTWWRFITGRPRSRAETRGDGVLRWPLCRSARPGRFRRTSSALRKVGPHYTPDSTSSLAVDSRSLLGLRSYATRISTVPTTARQRDGRVRVEECGGLPKMELQSQIGPAQRIPLPTAWGPFPGAAFESVSAQWPGNLRPCGVVAQPMPAHSGDGLLLCGLSAPSAPSTVSVSLMSSARGTRTGRRQRRERVSVPFWN